MTRQSIWRVGLLCAACWLAAPAPTRAELITTLPSWDGSSGVSTFGEGGHATFGQTITVGSDTYLTDFSFAVSNRSSHLARFAGYVLEWNANQFLATGPVLYDSGLRTSVSSFAYTTFTFSPNIQLVSGRQYVLFLSASDYFDGDRDGSVLGFVGQASSYSGGSFVFQDNDSDFGALTTSSWFGVTNSRDLAFTANLEASPIAAAPGPATLGLLGAAAVCLGCVTRYRRTKR